MAESIRSDVLPNSGITPRVWMGWGAVADAFAVMTRPAVESYGTVWSEFFDSTCMSLPQEARRRRRFCVDVIVPPIIYFGTECLIAMHLRRSGVQLSMRGDFRTGLWGRRGAPGSQSKQKKVSSAAPDQLQSQAGQRGQQTTTKKKRKNRKNGGAGRSNHQRAHAP